MNLFTNQTMLEVLEIIKKDLEKIDKNTVYEFEVINPDIVNSSYSGKIISIDNQEFIYRGYKSWVDMAQKLFCKMLTPIIKSENTVIIRFRQIDKSDSFHKNEIKNEEKYGVNSTFFNINKNEEPEILFSYLEALNNVKVSSRKRVLNLGVNSGEEFEIIEEMCDNFSNLELIGIDYCKSAIDFAKNKFKNKENIKFYSHDINKLDELDLGEFDLIISIGTLQSSNLDFNKTFMNIVQKYLKNDGSMILGFPNCRWIDGEIIYGAKAPNYSFSEMSILYKDAFFCKKYLQQKKFRVTLTGKYYIFLTATSIRK